MYILNFKYDVPLGEKKKNVTHNHKNVPIFRADKGIYPLNAWDALLKGLQENENIGLNSISTFQQSNFTNI